MLKFPTLTKHHVLAAALIGFAAAIPLGEGLSLALLGALVAMTLVIAIPKSLGSVSRPIIQGLALWLASGLLAVLLSGEGWLKPGEIGRWAPFLAIVFVPASIRLLPRVYRRYAVMAFVLSMVIACLFALLSYGFNIRYLEKLTRFDSSLASQGRVPGQYERTVAGGFYFHRLKMAHVLLVAMSYFVARLLYSIMPAKRRVLELLGFVLLSLTLLLTYTRAAFLGAAAGVAVCLIWAPRVWRWLAVGGAALAAGIITLIPTIRERLVSIGSSEASNIRALIWSQGVRVLADHPLGVGLGNYSIVIERYYDVVEPAFNVRTYPHSVVLAAWAETGPVGMVAYLVMWLGFISSCFVTLKRLSHMPLSQHEDTRIAAAAGLYGATALWVVGLTHDVLFHNAVALAFAALLGVVLSYLDDFAAASALASDKRLSNAS